MESDMYRVDPWQLVDELSMIYTTCLMCYATFSYSKSRLFSQVLALSLVSLDIFITLYYHYLKDPLFHQNTYALLTAVVLFRSMYVMEYSLRPSLTKHQESFKHQRKRSMTGDEKEVSRSEDLRDAKILSTMWTMVRYGLTIFLGGFAIWNLDNQLCSTLRVWRRQIGLPWGILLEGHGWWYATHDLIQIYTLFGLNLSVCRHLMTGIGAYFYIVWGIWLRHCLNGRQDEYTLRWPRAFSLPEVVRSRHHPHGGAQNGTMRKSQ